jgi:hypothetical protein
MPSNDPRGEESSIRYEVLYVGTVGRSPLSKSQLATASNSQILHCFHT